MDYTGKHAKALAKLANAGAPVVFTREVEGGTYDPITDTTVGGPAVSVIQGAAVELPGDPEHYSALNLIGQAPITLMFAPYTYGESPALHSVVSWAGALRTVQDVLPIRPDGVLIAAKVVVV